MNLLTQRSHAHPRGIGIAQHGQLHPTATATTAPPIQGPARPPARARPRAGSTGPATPAHRATSRGQGPNLTLCQPCRRRCPPARPPFHHSPHRPRGRRQALPPTLGLLAQGRRRRVCAPQRAARLQPAGGRAPAPGRAAARAQQCAVRPADLRSSVYVLRHTAYASMWPDDRCVRAGSRHLGRRAACDIRIPSTPCDLPVRLSNIYPWSAGAVLRIIAKVNWPPQVAQLHAQSPFQCILCSSQC